ncbi:MAG TPA: zinc ribbon domain-containing protein [Candidatus Poseidoniaceae archaeon]|nr:MAG TPA: zinc ribbon domain-containing protein [Candidatus Poseidoniales archaeon]HII12133.1 zinc ribbon domain-containing protein [Candidatus Poseidoniaceae archaeon]
MAGVYCPTCEAGVEAAAKFCLSCGHDLTGQGPITATGHDLNQLKEVIRHRDDLSMAEKFDMIAKVEEGSNPILLGIAAPAEGEDVDLAGAFGTELEEVSTSAFGNHEWGQSPAANAAVRAVVRGTNGWDLIQAGKLDLREGLFREAMDNGMEASTHIHDVASGEHEGIDPEAMRAIPVLKPPKRSFCPKCGSDIHANTMLQWRKWRDSSGAVVSMQLEASMETSLIQVAAHYLNVMQAMKDERDDAIAKATKGDPTVIEAKLREQLEKSIRKDLEKEIRSEMEEEFKGRTVASSDSGAKQPKKETSKAKSKTKAAASKAAAGGTKKKSSGMFGPKKVKKTYEGEAGGKADWFLKEALDTVYDPHGTGKSVKAATILARSSDGNVRVRDVVRIYDLEGEAGISELAWTSPLTKYVIDAYDAC